MALKALRLMGKKRGMTQIFDEQGQLIPCTVIEIEPNVVTQVKTKESDGYEAIQIGFDKVIVNDPRTLEKRVNKPQLGHFKKAGVEPCRKLQEARLEKAGSYVVGQKIGIEAFVEIDFVDVSSVSKGKGYQGVIKLHNFAGGPAAHGSGFHRHGGSTGMRTTPGRCLPGGKRASHMGYEQVTVQNLKVVLIVKDESLLFVKGHVPGPNGAVVTIAPAIKKQVNKKK